MKFIYQTKIVFVILLLFYCGSNDKPLKVVARVGNESLTIDELKQTIPVEYQDKISLDQIKQYIDRWVDVQLVYNEAVKRGFHNTYQEELHRELKKVEIEYLANKLIENQVSENINVSEEEIKKFYEDNKESYVRENDEIRTWHILAASKEEADEILKAVRGGESFEDLCLNRGDNKQSFISNDGDLGFISRDDIPQMLAKDVFKIKINALSRAIKSDFGYHLFKVIDKQTKGSYRTIDEVREQIKEIIKVEKRRDAYEAYLAQLRTHAMEQKKLRLNLELLKKLSPDTTDVLVK